MALLADWHWLCIESGRFSFTVWFTPRMWGQGKACSGGCQCAWCWKLGPVEMRLAPKREG